MYGCFWHWYAEAYRNSGYDQQGRLQARRVTLRVKSTLDVLIGVDRGLALITVRLNYGNLRGLSSAI